VLFRHIYGHAGLEFHGESVLVDGNLFNHTPAGFWHLMPELEITKFIASWEHIHGAGFEVYRSVQNSLDVGRSGENGLDGF